MQSTSTQYSQYASEEIDFQKYWMVLKRRWLAATGVFSAVVVASSLIAVFRDPTYEASASLLIQTDRSSSLVGLSLDVGNLTSLKTTTNPVATQAEIIRSVTVAKATIAALSLKNEDGDPLKPDAFAKKLDVSIVQDTDVLKISYESKDPEEAARVVNKVMEVFIASNIEANRAETASARTFITNQLPQVEQLVKQAEYTLRRFKEQNGIVSLDTESVAAVNNIAAIDKDFADTQATLAATTMRARALREQLGMNSQQAKAFTTLSQASGVQDILQKYQQIQSQLAIARTKFQDNHPSILSLQEQEAATQALLRARIGSIVNNVMSASAVPEGGLQVGTLNADLTKDLIDSEVMRLSLTSRINRLSQNLSTYRQRASVLPRLAQMQGELERQLKAAQTTYETLLTRLQEVQVAENQNVGNARVISTALLPDKPSGLSNSILIAAGACAGLFLAVLVAFLLDLIDRSIKTVQEARELFSYTALGVIPAYSKQSSGRRSIDGVVPKNFLKEAPRSRISEAYHTLQANLKFLSSDKELKVMVVTSSVPGEGKSTVSANLATAAAQLGRRVLLIDADMRNPRQHHIWDLVNTVGLSNVLVNQCNFDVAVQHVMPGLDVLTAGVNPPNPLSLLDSKRMAVLLESLSSQYDFIIVDTPPVAGLADAAILGKMADGLLLVVRPGVVDASSAMAAKEFLMQSEQNVLGIVANAVTLEDEPSSYYYYYYGKEREEEQALLPPGNKLMKSLSSMTKRKGDRS